MDEVKPHKTNCTEDPAALNHLSLSYFSLSLVFYLFPYRMNKSTNVFHITQLYLMYPWV